MIVNGVSKVGLKREGGSVKSCRNVPGAHVKVCGHALLVAPLVPGPGRPFDDEFSTLGCRGLL